MRASSRARPTNVARSARSSRTGKRAAVPRRRPVAERVGELLRLGDGPVRRRVTSRLRSSAYSASAAPRSPAASSRRISARWISSESGSSAAWRRVSATARRRSPARSAVAASVFEQRDEALAVLVARLEHPLVVEAGQERALAERERLLERPSARRRSASRTSTHVSGASPTRSRVATSASSPSERRSAQSALRRLARALSSSTSGQKREATAARGWGPGWSASQASRDARPPGRERRLSPSTSAAISPTSRSRSIVKA